MDTHESSTGHDVSQITNYLYISTWPKGGHADKIRALGVRLILSMHWRRSLQDMVTEVFEIFEFRSVTIEGWEFHIQSMILGNEHVTPSHIF